MTGEPATLRLVLTDFSATDLSKIEVDDIERLIMARDDIPGAPVDAVHVEGGYAFLHHVGDEETVRYRLVIE